MIASMPAACCCRGAAQPPRLYSGYKPGVGTVSGKACSTAIRSMVGAMYERCTRSIAAMYMRRSEEHTSELQSLMRISYAVFCLTKKNNQHSNTHDAVTTLPSPI